MMSRTVSQLASISYPMMWQKYHLPQFTPSNPSLEQDEFFDYGHCSFCTQYYSLQPVTAATSALVPHVRLSSD